MTEEESYQLGYDKGFDDGRSEVIEKLEFYYLKSDGEVFTSPSELDHQNKVIGVTRSMSKEEAIENFKKMELL